MHDGLTTSGSSPDPLGRGFPGGNMQTRDAMRATRAEQGWPTEYGSPRPPQELESAPREQPRSHRAPAHRDTPFLTGVIGAATGVGLFFAGTAMAMGPKSNALGQLLLFAGLLVPFATYLTVLMVPTIGRLREVTIALLGVMPTIVFRLSSPFVLSGYDEHLHDQELRNLLAGSGLFTQNPILKVGPFYPGLEIFAGTAIRLTGVPVILGESLVVLLCRVLLVLAIYYGALLVNPSQRGASLVVAFYAADPQFYEFNSMFAYQTLAVTLGVGGLVLLRRAQVSDSNAVARRYGGVAILLLIATVFTHHVTGWLVFVFLAVWSRLTRKDEHGVLRRAALFMGSAVILWSGLFSTHLLAYLGPIMTSIVQSVQAFTGGGASVGTPAPTVPTPLWEHGMLVIYVLGCCAAALRCAWIMFSRARQHQFRMLGFLGFCDLVFPATGAAHFDPSVGALGDRAATFLFFPLALSCSMIIMRDPRLFRHLSRSQNVFRPGVLAGLLTVATLLFFGGAILSSGPGWSRVPGPYLPSAEARSQDSETLAAVDWAGQHLAPGTTIVADRVPAALLEGQARMWTVTTPQGNYEPAYLYFSNTWSFQDLAIVKNLDIDYVYVDQRLAQSFPYAGFYISTGETHNFTRITQAELGKFAHVKGLKAVYSHGPVTIYSTYGLGVTPTREGFSGYNAMGGGPFDAVFGVALVALLAVFRRRLTWLVDAARTVGVLGSTLAVVAASIFIGGVLLELRLMPGPYFTVGAVAALAVVIPVGRRRSGQSLLPHLQLRPRLSLLVVLGVIAGIAGLTIALRAAYVTDIADVNAILSAIH
jgi:hypothetical protein